MHQNLNTTIGVDGFHNSKKVQHTTPFEFDDMATETYDKMRATTGGFYDQRRQVGSKKKASKLPLSLDATGVLAEGPRRQRGNSINKPSIHNIVDKSVSTDSNQDEHFDNERQRSIEGLRKTL